MSKKKETDTPLTDSMMAGTPPGAKPEVATVTWSDGFIIGKGAKRHLLDGVRVAHYKPALTEDGTRRPWGVEILLRSTADGKEHIEILDRRLFTTEKAAQAEFERCKAKMDAQVAEREASQPKAKNRQPSSDEEDLKKARLKVMRQQYPNTFKAMDALAQVAPEDLAEAFENVLRAHVIDLARLHKPRQLTKEMQLPTDSTFLLDLAKAYKAKSPFNAVDVEIAARWRSAGYNKMSLKEYTEAINSKADSTLKPKTMEKRRYEKLGLMTDKPVGPPPKE
jgi:hypothetical protein